jgi:DNA-binding transcriptional regulator GbsR (MarR family)
VFDSYFCRDRNNGMQDLTAPERKFVLHWGEMGARWGINRTVAQVHALLFLAPRPMPAETIQQMLGVARSNVSASLRELQGWGLVKLVHLPGDRRDHFETKKDVWDLFRTIVEERKRREVDPTLALLKECLAEAEADRETGDYSEARLRELHEFFDTTSRWYAQFKAWPVTAVSRLARLGDKAFKLLKLGEGREAT